MPIDRLIIHNFKSYGDKHVIGPFKVFSAVIGPNGAGKSNIMDAISFVLGVRTAQLRGSNLKDLICHTASKKTAFVEIVYRTEDENDAKEMHFKRTILPSGASQYSVNDETMSAEAYFEKLKEINVLVKARNFLVFQGDVESVASKSSKDLTEMIEQISGSAELKEAYEELKIAAEKAEEQFHRSFEKKKTMQKEEKQVREQKEEAERFQELTEDLRLIRVKHFLFQLFHITTDLSQARSSLKDAQEGAAIQKAALADAEAESKAISQESARIRREIADKEKEITKQSRQLEKKNPVLIKAKEQITHLTKTLKSTEAAIEKAREKLERHKEELSQLEGERTKVHKLKQKFAKSLETEEGKEIKLAEDQLAEYHRIKEEAGAKTAPFQQELDQLNREMKAQKEAHHVLTTQLATSRDNREQMQQLLSQTAERNTKMEAHVAELLKQLSEEQTKLKNLTATAVKQSSRRKEVEQKLAQIHNQLSEAKADIRDSERGEKMRDCIDTLKRLFPAVRGSLLDLCRPTQKKFSTAVEVGVGMKNLEAIVVDDEKTAKECILYMKEQRIGIATFIPLDTIKWKSIPEALRHLGGTLKPLIDVLDFDESIQKAVLYACGTTLVCDTLEEARKFCFKGGRARGGAVSDDDEDDKRYKVATLDGSIIHRTGNMTGGQADKGKGSRWDEKEVQKLRADRDAQSKELAELERTSSQDQEQSLELAIRGLESKLKYSQEDLKVGIDKVAKLERNLQLTDEDIAKKTPQLEKLGAELATFDVKAKSIKDKIAKEEDRLFSAFSKAVGVASIREYEEKRLALAESNIAKKSEIDQQESRLAAQIDFLKSKDLEAPLQQAEEKLMKDTAKLKDAKAEEAKAAKEIDSQKSVLDKKQEEIKVLKKEQDKQMKVSSEIKDKVNAARKELSTAEKAVTVAESKIESLRNTRHQVLRESKLIQIDLPLKSQGKRKKEVQAKKGRKKQRLVEESSADDDEKEASDEEDENTPPDVEMTPARKAESSQDVEDREKVVEDKMELDFSLVAEEAEVKSSAEYEQRIAQYITQASEIQSEMDKLAPNLKAIEQFADIKERMKVAAEDFESKKKASKTAGDAFDSKRSERYKLFMDAFEHISTEIAKIYADLTKSSLVPNGGTAHLSLENSEDPYLHGIKYTAMPPTKRFRDMDLLSGGEKTVAALALLFALHSFHPAPFFVLDEIDAALDNDNVNQVSNYIRKRCREDGLQCIVISLKDSFFMKADALVGIYKDQATVCSGSLTLDLTKYDRRAPGSASRRNGAAGSALEEEEASQPESQ